MTDSLRLATTCPHIATSDEGTSYCRLAEQTANSSAGLTGSPAPAGGLVERVAEAMGPRSEHAMEGGELPHGEARAAILVVAEWFDAIGYGATASILRQEMQRHG